ADATTSTSRRTRSANRALGIGTLCTSVHVGAIPRFWGVVDPEREDRRHPAQAVPHIRGDAGWADAAPFRMMAGMTNLIDTHQPGGGAHRAPSVFVPTTTANRIAPIEIAPDTFVIHDTYSP